MAEKKPAAPKQYVQYTDYFGKKLRGDAFGNLAPYRNGRPHRGGDWHPKELTPIKAMADGKVTQVFWSNVLGWVIEILAADGVYTQYSHIAPKTALVDPGEKVNSGDVIGKVGGGKKTPSGSASTGAHLHVAMGRVKNCHLGAYDKLIDPFKWIDSHSHAPEAAAVVSGTPAEPVAVAPSIPTPVVKAAAPAAAPAGSSKLTSDDWKAFQEILKRDHGYKGGITGVPDKETYAAIQRSVKDYGYTGPLDGALGTNSYKALQRRLVAKCEYEGRIDGSAGPQTLLALKIAIKANKY